MAAAKMEGLEVRPRSPSLAISLASVPSATKSRDRKSIHPAWPKSLSDFKAFMVSSLALFALPQPRELKGSLGAEAGRARLSFEIGWIRRERKLGKNDRS